MPDRECPEGLEGEALEGWVYVYGRWASTVMSPEAAVKSAERLRKAAEAAFSQRDRQLQSGGR